MAGRELVMSWMLTRTLIHAGVTMKPVAKNTFDYFQKEGDVMYLALKPYFEIIQTK